MLRRGSHAVYELGYHLVWIPKRRRPLLRDRVARRLAELLWEICEGYGWTLRQQSVQADHVHVFLEAPPRYSVEELITTLKSLTARKLFEEYPGLAAGLPSRELWSDGYFARAVGDHVTAQVIDRYIRYQEQGDKGQLRLWR